MSMRTNARIGFIRLTYVEILLFLLCGCFGNETDVLSKNSEQTVTIIRVTTTLTEIPATPATAMFTPTAEPTDTVRSMPTATSTRLPSPTLVPMMPPPLGTIYRTEDGLWQVGVNGDATLMLDVPKDVWVNVSPEGDRAIVETTIVDIASGQEFDLNVSEGFVVCCARWWPGRQDVVLVEAQLGSEWTGMGFGSSPAVVTIFDEEPTIRILGENPTSFGPPKISHNGEIVAFDDAGMPLTSNLMARQHEFSPLSFGFPNLQDPVFTHPAWSLDGRYIAWNVSGLLTGEFQRGIGLFDLETRTSKFLTSLEIEGFDGGGSHIYWSPNNENLVVWNHGKGLLWVVSADGTILLEENEFSLNRIANSPWNAQGDWFLATRIDRDSGEHIVFAISPDGKEYAEIGPVYRAVWSTDGNWLIVSNGRWWKGNGETYLIETGSWTSEKLDIPNEAYVFDWIYLGN